MKTPSPNSGGGGDVHVIMASANLSKLYDNIHNYSPLYRRATCAHGSAAYLDASFAPSSLRI